MRETILATPHALWLCLRLAAFGLAAFGGFAVSHDFDMALRAFPPVLLAVLGAICLMGLAAFVPLATGVFALGDYLSMESHLWRKPAFDSPPLPINPLVMFHFLGWALISAGIGSIVAVPLGTSIYFGLWHLAAGAAALLMLRPTMRLFRQKIAPTNCAGRPYAGTPRMIRIVKNIEQ